MKIGIDLMGGDFAPLEALKGIAAYLQQGTASVVMVGDEEQVIPLMKSEGIDLSACPLEHAPEVIGMHEHPTRALKEKPRSSISVGFGLLAQGGIDAFVSAGNTGAMLVGSVYS